MNLQHRLPPLAILLLAFFLRVLNLESRPMWYDESFAVLYAEKSFAQMWYGTTTLVQGVAADVHPLFYYTLLHGWMDIFGQSPFAVRFFSVFTGVATVAVVYRLAHTIFPAPRPISTSPSSFIFHPSSLIFAAAPFAIAYAQETRMYSLLGFTAALTILAYINTEQQALWARAKLSHASALSYVSPQRHVLPSNSIRWRGLAWWLLLILSAAAMLYSHNLAIFFGAALALWILIQTIRRRAFRALAAYAAAGVAILILWLPWLTLVPSQLGKIQQAYWISTPDAVTVLQTLLTFTVDFDNAQLPPILIPFALVAAILLLVLLLVEFLRGGWRDPRVGFLITLAFLPPLLIFLVSLWRPVYLTRALMPSFVMLILLVAWLLTRLPKIISAVLGVALTALTVASFVFYYPYADFPRPPFRDALNVLYANVQPSDIIVHDNKISFFPMYYYARAQSLPQHFIEDPPGAGSDTLALPTQQALNLYAEPLESVLSTNGRIWFVMFQEAQQDSATAANLEYVGALSRSHQKWTFHDLELYLFTR